MKKRRQKHGMSLLELAEAALHQVRLAPLDILTPYYIGSLPFILAILYFWADMIQGAFAYRHVHTSALAVAAAFIWMKCWQAVSCAKMRANLADSDTGAWGVTRIVRLAATQTLIHATGFFVLPVALLVMVPFGHAYAVYQNATVFGADEDNGVGAVLKRAWTEARRWPKQNHQIIWMFSPLPLIMAAGMLLILVPLANAVSPDWGEFYIGGLVAFYSMLLLPLSPIGVLVAVNVGMAIIAVPQLTQSLLGIDLGLNFGESMFNSTFYAICVGIAALCLDPVLKAAYVLRCFHGESLSSGEDLRIALRRVVASKGLQIFALGAAALALFAAAPRPALAQQDAPAAPAVRADELDRAISAELEKAQYVWRMPKEIPRDAFKDNFLTRFVKSVAETIRDAAQAVVDFLDWLFDKLSGNGRQRLTAAGAGAAWMTTQQLLWYFVFLTLLAVLLVVVYKIYKQRKALLVSVVATPVLAIPDLEDEGVSADALPEDGWLNLAQDMLSRGDLRLAMRALFLASLAALSHRDLLRVAKSKSNREYVRELERLAHAVPSVPPLFASGVRAFERVWYGNHEADRLTFMDFQRDQERIRALAKQQ